MSSLIFMPSIIEYGVNLVWKHNPDEAHSLDSTLNNKIEEEYKDS